LIVLIERVDRVLIGHHAAQRTAQEPQRLQRLAQIVTGRRQKAALGLIGAVGGGMGFLQFLLDPHAIRDIADRRGHQRDSNPPWKAETRY